MKLQILLTTVSLMTSIDSQSLKPTRTYNGYQPGSGQVFFEDNISRVNNNNPITSSDASQTNRQRSQTQLDNDSYLQTQQIQQNLRNGDEQEDKFKILNRAANRNVNLPNQNQNQYQTNLNNLQQSLNQNKFNYLHQAANQYNLLNQNQNQFLNTNPNYQFQPSVDVLPPSHTSQDYYSNKQHSKQAEVGDNAKPQLNVVPLTQSSRNASEDMRLTSAVISHIGIFMMKSARGNQSNVVVSPMSVVNMLALLQAGATGETQNQVSNALGLSPERSAATFQLINTEFQVGIKAYRMCVLHVCKKRGTERNVLRSASSIFAADSFDISRDFKNFAVQNFGSEVSRISFEDSDAAAQKINGWIARKTNDKIDKLVSPDTIGANTQLVLANAIYFKGLWETMFKPQATSQQDFFLSNGQKKPVPFMTLRSGFKAGLDTDNKAIVVVLPFEGKQYSLVMLLPVPGADVTTVLSTLNGDILADYQNLRRQDVLLEIPKFTVRSNTNLQPIFTKMGITKMFTAMSELNNIGLYRSTSPQVSSAVHSAMMSVDEQGATAAASTVVAVVALSYDNPSVVFRADRPFLAVLWDNQLNVPLFMTKIEDPSL